METKVRTCTDCQGTMSPIIIMDIAPALTRRAVAGPLTYRLPDDRMNFWSGNYPTAGVVQAFMCSGCARIALYGRAPDDEAGASADGGA